MSYDSYVSTFTVTGGKFDDISTTLYGVEGLGDKDNVIKGCGIITKNEDGSYTVKYAKEDNDTQYGALSLHVSFTSTPDKDCYFDGWYIGEDKSDNYKSAEAEILLDGQNYELRYEHKTTWNVKVVYHYDVYDNSKVKYYDEEQAKNDTKETYTVEDISVVGDSITDEKAVEIINNNYPNLVNDYYSYNVITDPKANDSEYGYEITSSGSNTCTINVHLKKVPRKYNLTVNGVPYIDPVAPDGGGNYTYQSLITINASEVQDLNVSNETNLIWKDANNDDIILATGNSYTFRITADTKLTAAVNEDNITNNLNSIITHKSYELKLQDEAATTSSIQKLYQNFYIADFCNNEDDSDELFMGGGVLYYVVDSETGKPAVATGAVDDQGIGDTNKLQEVVKRSVSKFNGTDIVSGKSDEQTKVVCRYVPNKNHENVFKYSESLQAFQYIFSASITNEQSHQDKKLRVYSYFVYYDWDTENYEISISENYADSSLYEEK